MIPLLKSKAQVGIWVAVTVKCAFKELRSNRNLTCKRAKCIFGPQKNLGKGDSPLGKIGFGVEGGLA